MKSIGKLVRGILAAISNKSNSIYRTNLLVHDMKDRYSRGREALSDLKNQIVDVRAQRKVNMDELSGLRREFQKAVSELKELDVANPDNTRRFNVLKTKYETLKDRIGNSETLVARCDSIIASLNKMVSKTESECETLKCRIDAAESATRTYGNLRRINAMIRDNTKELSDSDFDVSELERSVAEEVAKFEVLSEDAAKEPDVSENSGYVTDSGEMARFKASL
jgi:capsule polysaccharide export protein KpsE/RkpR